MKIIVNADDFGLSQSRNKAVEYAFENKICTQGSIIINTPYTEEAVSIAREKGFADKIGLHLNLTVGEPLTENIKRIPLYCKDGKFISSEPRSKNKVFSVKYIKEIREELEAQIIRFFEYGFTFRHIDTHNDIIFNMPVWEALKPLLDTYNIKTIRGMEPYLFGFYRKSIFSYLPFKYYFMYCHTRTQYHNTIILPGGRNINQFRIDCSNKDDSRYGNIHAFDVVEVLIHPEYNGSDYIDMTNIGNNKERISMDDTIKKLEGFTKTTYKELEL